MKRSVWSRDEIRDVLVSAQRASSLTAMALGGSRDGFAKAYEKGFAAALVVMATAFGLDATERSAFAGDGAARSGYSGICQKEREEERW